MAPTVEFRDTNQLSLMDHKLSSYGKITNYWQNSQFISYQDPKRSLKTLPELH